jgi:hypothetical protein
MDLSDDLCVPSLQHALHNICWWVDHDVDICLGTSQAWWPIWLKPSSLHLGLHRWPPMGELLAPESPKLHPQVMLLPWFSEHSIYERPWKFITHVQVIDDFCFNCLSPQTSLLPPLLIFLYPIVKVLRLGSPLPMLGQLANKLTRHILVIGKLCSRQNRSGSVK